MTATLRSNVHSRFLAPASLSVNDYFKKTNAQDWKLKHYLNYRLENENIIPTWTAVYNDWSQAHRGKNILLSDLLETTNKKRSQEDNYDNEAGPSNEKRSRHEDSSYEGTYQDEPQTPEYLFEIYDQDEEIKVMDARPLLWRIIDLSYSEVAPSTLSQSDQEGIRTLISFALQIGQTNEFTVLAPSAERCLRSLAKINILEFTRNACFSLSSLF
ncbi:hypothetical protein RhiirA1_529333 [Rhizophagus irregularis]|uniref:Uncharacterized protein n=1 Tax=Rhizophagus irregularis TaxID=588596 RepID=A0A2N0SGQ9_9GLOM|nr:hypothetical protein RhiirA1_529333 [Rhizophagus irregularis]